MYKKYKKITNLPHPGGAEGFEMRIKAQSDKIKQKKYAKL